MKIEIFNLCLTFNVCCVSFFIDRHHPKEASLKCIFWRHIEASANKNCTQNSITVWGPLFCNFRTRKSYKIRGPYYAFRIFNMKTASFGIKRVRKSITRFFVMFLFSQKSEKCFEKFFFKFREVFQKKFFSVLKNTFKSSQPKKPKKQF